MNQVVLIGRLTKDLTLRESKGGNAYTYFTVAVNNMNNQTDYISCVSWNKVAENMCKYLKQGSMVAVSGRLKSRTNVKDGQNQYIMEVSATSVTFLDTSGASKDGNYKPRSADSSKPAYNKSDKVNLDDAFPSPSSYESAPVKFVNNESYLAKDSGDKTMTFSEDDENLFWDN